MVHFIKDLRRQRDGQTDVWEENILAREMIVGKPRGWSLQASQQATVAEQVDEGK